MFNKKIYVDLDIQASLKVHSGLPVFPISPDGEEEGQLYYNSTDDNIYRFDGNVWLVSAGSSGTDGILSYIYLKKVI